MDAYVEAIKQYPGMVQVTRKVKVDVPGKHFPQLQAAEQKQSYSGTAVEYAERHKFDRHLKAWGQAHTGPGIRFICDSDAIDDPDHKGFWTTLGLWNRWRHDTYKDNRDAELQYLDMKPVEALTPVEVEKKEKAPPEIKQHFTVVSTGTHTVAGTGKMAGKVLPCTYFACKQPGCTRGVANPIKQVGTATGALFTHLDTCNPSLCKVLRGRSAYSPVVLTEDGEEYELYSFDELLPHHARFVQWCFRGWRHFYEGRSKNGLIEYIHEIRKALTGQECGVSFEDAAEPAQRATCQRDESGSGSEAGDSSGDDQEEGNRAKGKEYPLAHRCIDSTDWCVPPPLPFSLSILFSSVTLYSQAPQRHLRESSRSP